MANTGGGRRQAVRSRQPQRRRSMFSPTRGRSAQKMIIIMMVLGVVAAVFAVGIAASIGN